ncbi:MAG: FAD-dependent oxidoreductase [Prevotella sp.]|jgi:protoporphyrinogen oxidase|nr:FAD-dependent oxidoreductase [Prevotella sp.]
MANRHKLKIAIIGTGISGLSVANMLKERYEVTLFEQKDKIGGLIKCDTIDSVLFHRVGGHVFNSRNKGVFDWFWSHFDKENEFYQVKRNAKIFIYNKIIGYPIENYLYNFDKDIIKRVIHELILTGSDKKLSPFEYPNFEEFLKNNFGETLYNLYFNPYNRKIWGTELKSIPMPWLEGKLPMPNLEEIILSNIVHEEEDKMVHSTFYYPKKNGSQFLVDKLSEGLNIRLNRKISNILKDGEKYTIDGETGFDKIIYTGDVRNLPDYADNLLTSKMDLNALKSLKSNGTSNILCETDSNSLSWLYIPEDFTKAHRIIYTGNFSPANNGTRSRKTCVAEFSGKVEYDDMIKELNKLPGNLTPISYNYEPNSYVIHDFQTKELINEAKAILKDEGIHLLGRFAEWEYYNMDKCIESAMKISAEI